MGRKFTVPYGLYRCHGFVNPFLAHETGFGSDDLDLFWQALTQMFELDRSASRGQMAPQALIVFEHNDALGNAPAHKLQERVKVERTGNGVPHDRLRTIQSVLTKATFLEESQLIANCSRAN